MTNEQLGSLGLNALGDILTLREYCQCKDAETTVSAAPVFTSNQPCQGSSSLPSGTAPDERQAEKRKKLLKLLCEMGGESTQSAVKKKPGRPSSQVKPCTIGLRLSKGKRDNVTRKSGFQQVKCPLGDKTMLSMNLSTDSAYHELLQTVREAFFS
jgi:hypothetical protein